MSVIKDTKGDAIVEATILFPLMIMVFAALVMLAIYLPTRAALQRATQYAATALATERSDTWLFFDENAMTYYWETDKKNLENVYAALFSGIRDAQNKGDKIVKYTESRGLSSKAGKLSIDCYSVNKIVYTEIVVTATREFNDLIELPLIGFPKTLSITVTSTAVVQNGDEFIRNMDLAVDFISYIGEKFGLTDIADTISSNWKKVEDFFGWRGTNNG